MDLGDIRRRIDSGEGMTLSEAKNLLKIVTGEKLDLPQALQEGMPSAIRCIRQIIEQGESETAQIAAAKFWVEMFENQVIADDGQIAISFDLMDDDSRGAKKKEVQEVDAETEKSE